MSGGEERPHARGPRTARRGPPLGRPHGVEPGRRRPRLGAGEAGRAPWRRGLRAPRARLPRSARGARGRLALPVGTRGARGGGPDLPLGIDERGLRLVVPAPRGAGRQHPGAGTLLSAHRGPGRGRARRGQALPLHPRGLALGAGCRLATTGCPHAGHRRHLTGQPDRARPRPRRTGRAGDGRDAGGQGLRAAHRRGLPGLSGRRAAALGLGGPGRERGPAGGALGPLEGRARAAAQGRLVGA